MQIYGSAYTRMFHIFVLYMSLTGTEDALKTYKAGDRWIPSGLSTNYDILIHVLLKKSQHAPWYSSLHWQVPFGDGFPPLKHSHCRDFTYSTSWHVPPHPSVRDLYRVLVWFLEKAHWSAVRLHELFHSDQELSSQSTGKVPEHAFLKVITILIALFFKFVSSLSSICSTRVIAWRPTRPTAVVTVWPITTTACEMDHWNQYQNCYCNSVRNHVCHCCL